MRFVEPERFFSTFFSLRTSFFLPAKQPTLIPRFPASSLPPSVPPVALDWRNDGCSTAFVPFAPSALTAGCYSGIAQLGQPNTSASPCVVLPVGRRCVHRPSAAQHHGKSGLSDGHTCSGKAIAGSADRNCASAVQRRILAPIASVMDATPPPRRYTLLTTRGDVRLGRQKRSFSSLPPMSWESPPSVVLQATPRNSMARTFSFLPTFRLDLPTTTSRPQQQRPAFDAPLYATRSCCHDPPPSLPCLTTR